MLSAKNAKINYNFKIKKSLGQNFLNNNEILDNIVNGANIDENSLILEIGPGLGALTERLVKKAKAVLAVEYDKSLEKILKENIREDNFILVIDDFLRCDLTKLLEKFNEYKTDSKYKIQVVANLPYYITSAIIMKILESNEDISSLTIMLQKEVANRIFAKTKTKDYGLLTIWTEYYAIKEFLFDVGRENFTPIPKVDSAVIKLVLKNKNENNISEVEEKILKKILSAAFSQRRKTLVNSLVNANIYTKEKVEEVLTKLKFNLKIRPEELTLEEYKKLYRGLEYEKY